MFSEMEKNTNKKCDKNNSIQDSNRIEELNDMEIARKLKNDKVKKEKLENSSLTNVLDYVEKQRVTFLRFTVEVDLVSAFLFISGLLTRIWRLDEPNNIVFDELHYGKYISLYMKNTFFFDTHPPLGKQLIAIVAYFAGYDGKFKFDRIGSPYTEGVPILALRALPALFGSMIIPTAYHVMLELGLSQWTAFLAGLLLLMDNALLTQSRFILMESMLLFFALFGILCVLKFRHCYDKTYSLQWFFYLTTASIALTLALCIKYAGFYSCLLAVAILARDFWRMLAMPTYSNRDLILRFLIQSCVIVVVPVVVYIGIFYAHLSVLYKAGPHDSIMTSAFQASLEGGLASITRGQPLLVAHGSQITLRHTHGRTCWLHSHTHVYPVRYADNRGSSHQQQVTCYSFKDVNNWWIVKRPKKNDLVVEEPIDSIKHGDIIQLVHGITSRALNSHDVAAPQSPQCQEVSCYIDYNVSMSAQNYWQVDIVNRDQFGDTWHTIQSLVRLIHVDSNQALKFTGRQLHDWGFHQHEVAADRIINQDDTIWNVEEHRYTKSDDQKERERDMVSAEMIPTKATSLSFWNKFFELHYKMMFSATDGVQNHMYSSEPLEWPLMSRGIAYYISSDSNAQIHLLGNFLIWYSSTLGVVCYLSLLIFYLLRQRRNCYDLSSARWQQFQLIGDVLLVGYLFHFIPYFFIERTLFVHHYLPALTFKVLLLSACIEHVSAILSEVFKLKLLKYLFTIAVLVWVFSVVYVFRKFSVLSYGFTDLTTEDIISLRWKDTWDFIVHKN